MKKLLLLISFVAITSCQGQDCKRLPKTFANYAAAQSAIEAARFDDKDEVDTSSSSWISAASFYSCDGAYGYLIIETTKSGYIFKNVPLELWSDFKKASSFGKFYNQHIRGKFQMAL